MSDKKKQQAERIQRYAHMIEEHAGKAVRPYRADGYVNMMNRYGTSKDATEHYRFAPEPDIPDDALTLLYEGNGLFAKVIDAPAEEAIKHGFTLEDVSDQEVETFYQEALDELDWEEVAMTGIKWARLFGGAIAVMLINDGGGLEEPLNWKRIKSIDDIRVYERSVVQPDFSTMFSYDPRHPFSTRGSRLGMPEFYRVNSRYGSFVVHESRCLVFQNGVLPENSSNTIYQFWGMPEYIRIHRALRDAEVAHGSGPKMLDRSVQPVYKMKDLAALLATEEGESQVLKRLQVIDLARGLLNSLVIDNEGEDYDFKTFQYTGVADVIDATCNFLSALTNIPQSILFGRAPQGMSDTGEADQENWYSYNGRIQKRMIKSNLRYLLSIIFRAGVYTGEVDEVPKIKIKFNPLKVLSDSEQAELDNKKASTALIKAQTVQIYRDMEVLDSIEIRKKLADSGEFEIDTILDEYEDEEELLAAYTEKEVAPGFSGNLAESGDFDQYATEVNVEEHENDPGTVGSAPANAPAATKLPQDMSEQEKAEAITPDNMQEEIANEWRKANAQDGAQCNDNWITMNGTHVLVGEEGTITSGPPNLKGKKYNPKESKKTKQSGPKTPRTQKSHRPDPDSYVGNKTKRISAIVDDTGVSEERANDFLNTVDGYTGSDYRAVRHAQMQSKEEFEREFGNEYDYDEIKSKGETLEEFIDKSPQWEGQSITRTVCIKRSELRYEMNYLKRGGEFTQGGVSSWSSDADLSEAKFGAESIWDDSLVKVVFTARGKVKGTSISHLSDATDELEVLVSKNAVFRASKVNYSYGVLYVDCEQTRTL